MAKKKIKVVVLIGGPSSEHEISLKTGEMVLKNLDKKKFLALPIKIKKNGRWPIALEKLKKEIDVAFVAMHGEYGEDGQIQNLLETFKIPYTGSGPISSAIAMDKQKTASLLEKNRLLIPKSLFFLKSEDDLHMIKTIIKNFKLPVVIKPTDRGSSVGISIVNKKNQLKKAIKEAFKYSKSIMAQQYIKGKEITCGVLEINKIPVALPPTEIIPNVGNFFDYRAKYNKNGSIEITPPQLPKKIIKKIQNLALKTHKILGCSGMSRTDMILQNNKNLYILELNTIPGLTQTSLLPQQARKIGIEFPKLLEIIIRSALDKS